MSLTTGQQLPDFTLTRADGQGSIQVRPPGRKGIILVLLHGPACDVCRDYVQSLGHLAAEIEEWDGRIVLVSGAADDSDSSALFEAPSAFHQARDDARRVVDRTGVTPPAVLVADQWGELFAVEGAGEDHTFLIQPEEVVEWLRFLATSCPECEGEAL